MRVKHATKFRPKLVEETLSRFAQLVINLPKLTEVELKACLDTELEKGKDARPGYCHRLHQRYNSLRRKREREEMSDTMKLKGDDRL